MKHLITLSALLTLPAFAVDYTENNDRAIYDLMYLPTAGTNFGQSYIVSAATVSKVKQNGTTVADVNAGQQVINQFLGRSFTDSFAVAIQFDYLMKQRVEVDFEDASNSDEELDSKGFGDPSLGFKYRLLNQKDSTINLDISPLVTFGTGDSISATDDDEGNNKNGGNTYSLDVTVGKKFNEIQWTAFIGIEQSEEAKSKDATTKEKSKAAGHSTFSVGGQFLRNINEKWVFDFMVRMSAEQGYKDKADDGTYTKFGSITSLEIAPEFTYYETPNLAFLGRASLISTNDYKLTDETGTEQKYEDNATFALVLGAKYQF